MALFVKDGNVWKESGSGGLSVKDANTWKEVDTGFVKDAGVWKEFYKNSVFWRSKFDRASVDERDFQTLGVDPNGAFAVLATCNKYNTGVDIVKVDATGAFQWAKNIATLKTLGVAIDSSGNIYLGTLFGGLSLLKFNSSGTLQWTRTLVTGIGSLELTDVLIDSSGNIFLHGDISVSPTSCLIAKFNSSGTLLSQVSISPRGTSFTSDFYAAKDIHLDSSGNLLINGESIIGGTFRAELALIVNNALNSKIFETRNTATGNTVGKTLLKESSGALISISGDLTVSGCRILRWTSGGSYRSQKTFAIPGSSGPSRAAIDANDNIYIVGQVSSSGDRLAFVIKYNLGALPSSANGTDSSFIEWARLITVASGGSFIQSFAFDVKVVGDGIYVSGEYFTYNPSNGFDSFYCKLDANGTTGTTNGITISDGASLFTLSQNTSNTFGTVNNAAITTRSYSVSTNNPTVSNSTYSYSTAIAP